VNGHPREHRGRDKAAPQKGSGSKFPLQQSRTAGKRVEKVDARPDGHMGGRGHVVGGQSGGEDWVQAAKKPRNHFVKGETTHY